MYRETYKQIVNFRNGNMSTQERVDKLHQHQLEVKQMENDVHKEIAQWTEHSDEQGNRFYFNREERQSTWTDPRPAKCQILYLKMKMLRLLQSSMGGTQGIQDMDFKRPRDAPSGLTSEGEKWGVESATTSGEGNRGSNSPSSLDSP